MIVLSVENLHKSYGIETVLGSINFSLQNGEKMGLVGVNGSGKTTLMKILCGEIEQTSGNIHISKNINIGYIAQNNDIPNDVSVYDAMLSVFEKTIKLENDIKDLEHEMANTHDDEKLIELTNIYHRLHDEFNKIEGYAYRGEIVGVLKGLGFDKDKYDRLVGTFSGGERTRLSLAKLLLKKPQIIMMDEPTNHLDLDAMSWLEEYLKSYSGAVIVISHDRYFLDNVCTSIGEIIAGKMIKYTGNYSDYQKKRAITYEAELKAYNEQQKYIAKEKAIIERYKSFNREKSIKAAESRQKRLDKIDIIEKPIDEKSINFSFEARLRSGEEVLKVRDLSKSFDDKILFKNINFDIKAGDRIALIGKNGVGKSTLFNIIAKKLESDSGYTIYGTNVDTGYFEQHHDSLDQNKNILDNVWDFFPMMNQSEIRGALGMFLFSGEDVFKYVKTLSGGEKARILLTKLMLRKNNFLLLDEPTNHLDSDSREVLEEALNSYTGTIFAISHDRYFINKFANKIFLMDEENIKVYLGNWDDYISKKNFLESIKEENTEIVNKTAIYKANKKSRENKQYIKKLENRLKEIENLIIKSEENCQNLEIQLSDPELYKDFSKYEEVKNNYESEQESQANYYDEMEKLEKELQEFQ